MEPVCFKNYTDPIITLNAHAVENARKECISAGCVDYAFKSINRKKLIEIIKTPAEKAPPESAPQ